MEKGTNQRAREYVRNLEHRRIWVSHYGTIPEGYVVHHKNGDKKDNRIENLQCVSIKEHGKLHQLSGRKRIVYPSGAVKVIRLADAESKD